MSSDPEVTYASTVAEAAGLLADPGSAALAGATWIMRRGLRGDPGAERYVALDRLAELRGIARDPLRIGALVTHTELAAALAGETALAALRSAASDSANPNVRNVATVGGAIGARDFPASDIVTALLALDAELEVATADGSIETVPLASYLDGDRHALVIAAIVPDPPQTSAHVRLTQRSAGDYPAAIVSLAVRGAAVAVAVGSVEQTPRRWPSLERQLAGGGRPEPDAAAEAARATIADWTPRESVELPPWYRTEVLPELVRRAASALQEA